LASGARPAPASPTPALGRRAARGAAWIAFSFGATQVLAIATNLLLARVLSPQDFGLVAMANLLLAFAGPFHDSGLLPAFVALKDRVRESAATIAWSTPVTGLGVAAVTVLAAPLAGALFARPDVVPVIRVLALVFVLNGLAVAPLAVISRELAFRSKAAVAIIAALTEGIVGIGLALRGAGYWSLVGAQLARAAVTGLAAWWLAPWKPLGRFAWARFREMARFGRHMVAGNLLGLLGSYLDNIVVGRWLGAEALGLYGTAFRWGRLPSQALGTTVNQVAFPSYVAVSAEPARLKAAYLRVLRTVSTLVLPASLGLLVIAPVLVASLYPPRWAGMVTPLQIFAVFGLVNAIVATTGDVFKAADRPGWIPGLAVVHLPSLAVALWVLTPYGPAGAASGLLLATVVSGAVALTAAFRLLGVSMRELAGTVGPPASAALVMAAAVEGLRRALAATPGIATLLVLVAVGVLVYAAALRLLGRERWHELTATVRDAISGGS
jgi:polysaccharide transporter, PST family